jgi:hypothetical protein
MGFIGRLFGKQLRAKALAFNVAHNLLYQPDAVFRERIVDIDALGDYLNQIYEVAEDYWVGKPAEPGQALTIVIAIKPGGRVRFWLDSSLGKLDSGVAEPLIDRLQELPVPVVREGPIAFAIHASLWGGSPGGGGWTFLPAEWKDRCRLQGQKLVFPDGVLELVWPD